MVRHGEAPDPKGDMMYPDGLGRVIHRIRRASPPCYQLSSQ